MKYREQRKKKKRYTKGIYINKNSPQEKRNRNKEKEKYM